MANPIERSTRFIRNVLIELKRVTWPTRRQLISYTVTVLITVTFIAVFFALIDLGISKLIRVIL
ncbi:MAG TPA: preprotein translocase subunit SecE [Bacillales bacterium]|nr:preprotein translocase subunit SecE [Bacillales bacterium]